MAGVGIGFLPMMQAVDIDGLLQVMPPQNDWVTPLWLVTHVDLHRTSKVTAISRALMRVAEEAVRAEQVRAPMLWGEM
jgi:DNA-binding transcriptional LysR family regulator